MNKERLLKLADHLEHGKLGHERFNFRYVNADDRGLLVVEKCGTVGCAMGECPIVWPDEWVFTSYGVRLTRKRTNFDYDIDDPDVAEFFDLNQAEIDHLFYPRLQSVGDYGGQYLGSDATKEQVAANIRAFVEKCERE